VKRWQKETLEELIFKQNKTNFLLEQLIRLQAIANNRLIESVKAWHKDDLEHHAEENNLIKKVIKNDEVTCSTQELGY